MGRVGNIFSSDQTLDELVTSLHVTSTADLRQRLQTTESRGHGEEQPYEDAPLAADTAISCHIHSSTHSCTTQCPESPASFPPATLLSQHLSVPNVELLSPVAQQPSVAVGRAPTIVIEEGGRFDYGFTKEEIGKYVIRRKKKAKQTCANWEDVVEESRNEPWRIRSSAIARRNG